MKSKTNTKNILNRRAKFDYELGEELVVGMSLIGAEVRAIRDGRVSLKGSFITVRQGKKGPELWLNNASFSLKNLGEGVSKADSVDTTPKKLLAHRREIENLYKQKQSGFTIVPLKILSEKRHIKTVIAVGKGKKKYDKRETLKRKQSERESARIIKGMR